MAEPTSLAVFSVTAGGLTVFGFVTGLQPELLIAGMVGGWWGLSYGEPRALISRVSSVALAAISSAWGTPAALSLAGALSFGPPVVNTATQMFIALALGRVMHVVFGSPLDAMVKRKMEEV